MLNVDERGVIRNARIINAIATTIERGPMVKVKGIIVHQTGGPTASSTLHSYKNANANGAHFLIDKDGTIYQTASVLQKTQHVGKLRSRCLTEMRCTPAEMRLAKQSKASATHKREIKKSVPDRYPSNEDSIGIEIVGQAFYKTPNPKPGEEKVYEAVTKPQDASLKWLISELRWTLNVPLAEIHRHPAVSYKNETEASSASW